MRGLRRAHDPQEDPLLRPRERGRRHRAAGDEAPGLPQGRDRRRRPPRRPPHAPDGLRGRARPVERLGRQALHQGHVPRARRPGARRRGHAPQARPRGHHRQRPQAAAASPWRPGRACTSAWTRYRSEDAIERLESPLDGNDLMRHLRPAAGALDQAPQRLSAGRGHRGPPRQGRHARAPASWPSPSPANTTSSERSRSVETRDPLVDTDWLAGPPRRPGPARRGHPRLRQEDRPRRRPPEGRVPRRPRGVRRGPRPWRRLRGLDPRHHRPRRPRSGPGRPARALRRPDGFPGHRRRDPRRRLRPRGRPVRHPPVVGAHLLRPRPRLRPRRRLEKVDLRGPADDQPRSPSPSPPTFTPRPRPELAQGGRRGARREPNRRSPRPRRAGRGTVHGRGDAGRGACRARPRGEAPPRRRPLRTRERDLPLRRGAGARSCARPGCRRTGTSPSSPTATAGSRRPCRSSRCTGSATGTSPTTTARGTSGARGRTFRPSASGPMRMPRCQRSAVQLLRLEAET